MSTVKQANAYLAAVETRLEEAIHTYTNETVLEESMMYSVRAGGKRIRPLLVLSTACLYTKEIPKAAIDVASALEMIHTYSLIHDDLPAMDDDDLRRGKPTNHKVFGEDMAILAGDALLTLAFQIVATTTLEDALKVEILALLAQTAGPSGMVAGQVADMRAENRQITYEELKMIHERKTGELIRFAVLSGAIMMQAPKEERDLLEAFSRKIGLAFQIRDDILDVVSTTAELGKTAHRDETLEKSTYPKLLGLAAAKQALQQELDEANQVLEQLAHNGRMIEPLAAIVQQLALKEEA